MCWSFWGEPRESLWDHSCKSPRSIELSPAPFFTGRFIQTLLTVSSRHTWYLPAAQMHYDLMWGSIRAAAASYYIVTKPLPFSSWGVAELPKRKYCKTTGSSPVPCCLCSGVFTRCLWLIVPCCVGRQSTATERLGGLWQLRDNLLLSVESRLGPGFVS